MSQNDYLMFENTPVLEINLDIGLFDVLDEKHLPFNFKNSIQSIMDYTEVKSHYDDVQRQIAIRSNNNLFTMWLASRTLILLQHYAKKLFQAYRLPQKDDVESRTKLSLACKSLSLLDNYWVRPIDFNIDWTDINLRHNSLHKAIAQIQLHGKSMTLNGKPDSLAFSTTGAYAKAWHRDADGSLWLYKAGDNNSEDRIEVMCSNILDRCNVAHCYYEERFDDDLRVCACPSMTSDKISIVDGDNFISYCNHNDINVDEELIRLDPEGYWKMMIVDYLLSNPDRHTQNWGLYYKADSMEILGLHPLYDHNNAFDIEVMDDVNYDSHFRNSTLQKNALYAMKQVDFHFTAPITRDLFITDRQYKSFMSKAEELGVKIKEVTLDDLYIQYGGFKKYRDEVFSLMPGIIKENIVYAVPSLVQALKCVQGTHNCYRRNTIIAE